MLPVAVVWFRVVRFGSGGRECFICLFLSLPCLAYNFLCLTPLYMGAFYVSLFCLLVCLHRHVYLYVPLGRYIFSYYLPFLVLGVSWNWLCDTRGILPDLSALYRHHLWWDA